VCYETPQKKENVKTGSLMTTGGREGGRKKTLVVVVSGDGDKDR
jgi:hypothetical protein